MTSSSSTAEVADLLWQGAVTPTDHDERRLLGAGSSPTVRPAGQPAAGDHLAELPLGLASVARTAPAAPVPSQTGA